MGLETFVGFGASHLKNCIYVRLKLTVLCQRIVEGDLTDFIADLANK